jgi:hypothetical protein
MDMSTHSTAENLEGVVDVRVAPETTIVPGGRKKDELAESNVAEPLIESTHEVPMQFLRLGLPAAIFLWVAVALVVYGAYQLLAS